MRTIVVLCLLLSGCGAYPAPELVDPNAPLECHTEQGPFLQVAPNLNACFDFQQVVSTCAEAIGDRWQMSVNLFPYLVRQHPESNGLWFPPSDEQRKAGLIAVYGQCWCDGREIELASVDWTWLQARNVMCHELGHAVLGCYAYVHDHDYMTQTGYEAKANELNQRDLGY